MLRLWFIWLIWAFYVSEISSKYEEQRKIILCLGDSITRGTGSTDKALFSYPTFLQQYLNEHSKLQVQRNPKSLMVNYEVINLGVPGASVSRNNNRSYWDTTDFAQAQSYRYKASTVIIGLGTNDAKTYVWNQTHFLEQYDALVKNITAMPSHPRIFLIIPPPCYNDLKYSTANC